MINRSGNLSEHIEEVCRHHFSNGNDMTTLMLEIFAIAEEELTSILTDEEIKHIECRPGCCICCRVNVPVLPPEAAVIKDHLINTRNDAELNTLRKQMTTLIRDIRYMDEDERIFLNKECVFLSNSGNCTIYSVRPLMCRSVTSADASACKSAMNMLALGESVFVPMNINQKSVMDTVFRSIAHSLKEHNLSDKSGEITQQVYNLLDT